MNEMKFKEIFPISAKTGVNIDELLKSIINILPEGPKFIQMML